MKRLKRLISTQSELLVHPGGSGLMVEGAAAEAAENWSERKTSEGRRFYYNSVTKQRTWKLPPALDKHPLVRASSRKKKQRSVSVGPRERPISDEGGGERGRVTTKGSSTGPSGRQHRAVDDEGFSYRPDAVDQEYEEEEFKPIIKNLVIKQKIAAPMEPQREVTGERAAL
ncbi:MAG: hypothetical protein SGPRY_000252 [Prymnesium sp.]